MHWTLNINVFFLFAENKFMRQTSVFSRRLTRYENIDVLLKYFRFTNVPYSQVTAYLRNPSVLIFCISST